MFAWVYFHKVNHHIDDCMKKESSHWNNGFHEANSSALRVKDLMQKMGWDVCPWWDFLGWVTNLRTNIVTFLLNDFIDTQKAAAIQSIALGGSSKLFSSDDVALVTRMKGEDLSQISSWSQFEKASKLFLKDQDEKFFLSELEKLDSIALEAFLTRAESGDDVSFCECLVQTFLLRKLGVLSTDDMSARIRSALERFEKSSGLEITLSSFLNQKADFRALKKEGLKLHQNSEPKEFSEICETLFGGDTSVFFENKGLKFNFDKVRLNDRETQLKTKVEMFQGNTDAFQKVLYQTVEAVATRAAKLAFLNCSDIQVGKRNFEARFVTVQEIGAGHVEIIYGYTAPFVRALGNDETNFGSVTSVHTYTLKMEDDAWKITDLQFQPLQVLVD